MKPIESSARKTYARPAVIVELELEAQAGSTPVGDPRRGKPSREQQAEPPAGE